MLDRIEYLAHVSVGRACGFAALGVGTFILGVIGDIKFAFKWGGFFALIVCLVLFLKAILASRKPYRRTEVWLMLKPDERPQAAIAQQIISAVLRETYTQFALTAGLISAFLLGASIVLSVTGP